MSQEKSQISKRLGYISPAQRSLLVELVKSDSQIINGKFTHEFTFQHARQKWEEIAKQCNAIPGGSKDWKHWRKTWQDIRSKTKAKMAAITRHSSGTGGGSSTSIQSTNDESSVLDIISPITITGHTESTKSAVDFAEISYGFVDSNINTNTLYEVVDSSYSQTHTEENVVEQEISSSQKKNKTKRVMAQSSLGAMEMLASQLKRKITIKKEMNEFMKEYYKKKITILQENAEALKSIAASMEKIANKK